MCLGARLAEQSHRLGADALERDPETFQDSSGDTLTLSQQPEEKVFRTYVAVVKAPGLINSKLYDPLGARGQPQLTGGWFFSPTHDELYGGPHLAQAHPQISEHLCCHPILFPDQAQQYVFSINVAMIEALRFLLCQTQCPTRPLRKFFKPAGHNTPIAGLLPLCPSLFLVKIGEVKKPQASI